MKHCSKCGGYGIINGYSHVKGGTCFKCGGKNTRGNWKEEEKKAKKERLAKKKRIEEIRRKIYGLEKTLALFENYPPETAEEIAFVERRKALLKSLKEENNQINTSQKYAI